MGAHISSVRIVQSDREVEHEAKIREAAAFLISPAPRWLVKVLSDFSFEIASQHGIDQIFPEKRQMLDAISEAQTTAYDLIQVLNSSCVSGYISAHSADTTEDFQRELVDSLQKFLAGASPARISLLKNNGNVRSGRGKASFPNTMSAKYTCAAIISEAADVLTVKRLAMPRQTNLFKAATELWTSRLPLDGWGNSRTLSWKRYFEAADDDRLAGLRGEVRRHLNIRIGAHSREK